MVGQFAVGGGGEFTGVGGEFACLLQRFTPGEPILVATGFPMGEVGGVDGGIRPNCMI